MSGGETTVITFEEISAWLSIVASVAVAVWTAWSKLFRPRVTPADDAPAPVSPRAQPVAPAVPAAAHYVETPHWDAADEQTDGQTDQVSEDILDASRLRRDITKTALIELLVEAGWDVGQIRGVIKGDNGVIGAEVAAARARLGIAPPTRTINVRDPQAPGGSRPVSV